MGGGGGRGGETPQPTHRSAGSGGGGGGGRSELFICFTPRSISMCAPSGRSLSSPGHNYRDAAAPPLSASRSRRLRSSGSLKGGQSPMFPAQKGGAFRAAEPSSPKVTCIGQVRVKSKAKNMGEGAALRSRSDSLRRRQEGKNSIGEEERECSRNQSWVYQLPTSIYEALRAIGSEFNCFLPCGKGRSPCFSSSKAREEKVGVEGRGEKRSASSCGVLFARWLMAIEESEEGEGGEMAGLVVGERERELDLVLRERENWEAKVEEVGKEGWVEEVVCVPPKNALLLMRCRSDPVKMAALTSRFFGSPAAKVEAEEEEEDDGNEESKEVAKRLVVEEAGEGDGQESNDEVEADAEELSPEAGEAERKARETQRSFEGVTLSVSVKGEDGASEDGGCVEKEKGIKEAGFLDESLLTDPNEVVEAARTDLQEKQHEKVLNDETVSLKRVEEKEEGDMKGKESSSCSSEYNKEKEENIVKKETEETRSNRFSSECNKEGIRRSSSCKEEGRRRHSFSTERGARRHSFSTEREARRASISVDKEGRICWSFIIDKEEMEVRSEDLAAEAERNKKKEQFLGEEEKRKAEEVEKRKRTEEAGVLVPEERREEEEEGGGERKEEEEEQKEKREELPDCLLLMTYEPKLSMEVSRETWVRSTNFPQGHHHHHGHSPTGGRTKRSKGKAGVDNSSDHGRRVKVDKVGDGRCVESMEVIQSIESSPQQLPPLPPVPPLRSAVEETLLSGVAAALVPAFEPFVLTRCKSEPVRPSARLVADGGFWKNRHKPVDAIGF
ncbi:enolase-phosphatase E1-like [Cocos nucifera]|uniref:Enolase-phosphatase E1-like n=1 Tax=Cocos nucifera TaxID=13894 RepID=A0A8K0IBA4_COCNU|nr:enolase-phosphatase E1-like [Cocos nucifera]